MWVNTKGVGAFGAAACTDVLRTLRLRREELGYEQEPTWYGPCYHEADYETWLSELFEFYDHLYGSSSYLFDQEKAPLPFPLDFEDVYHQHLRPADVAPLMHEWCHDPRRVVHAFLGMQAHRARN